MHARPRPDLSGWPRGASSVHGALAAISGGHGSAWSLWPRPGGLTVFWHDEEVGRRVAEAGPVEVELWGRRTVVSWGEELAPPARMPSFVGTRQMAVQALTPVVARTDGGNGAPSPDENQVCSLLSRGVTQRLGLRQIDPEDLDMRMVSQNTRTRRVNLGGRPGRVTGWVGEVVIRGDATVAALLSSARACGLGSRTSFGCGFISAGFLRAG